MGQLQKTSSGLARRMLNFEATHSENGTKDITNLAHTIKPISEAVENSASEPSEVVPQSAVRRITKPVADVKPVTKSNDLVTARDVRKPWRAGKASKNAVNSEVQSQSWAQRVIQTPSTSKVHSLQPSPVTKLQKTPPASSLQRSQPHSVPKIQLIPKFDFSQPQSKCRAVKTELPKIKTSPRALATTKAADNSNSDGWETVRGRTRSRTSPIKNPPQLTRASTMICTSRRNNDNKSTPNGPVSQRQCRLGLLKPSATQSLPSLCDDVVVSSEAAAPAAEDQDQDQLVEEEEAEMARREEALTKEEENLQRELRETERSDNECDEWDDPINVTPVNIFLYYSFICVFYCYYLSSSVS